MSRIWVIGCMTLVLAGCAQPNPQRPSHRKGTAPQKDSTLVALMEMNQRMTQAADEQLLHAVQGEEGAFALYEHGTWAAIRQAGDRTRPVRPGETCTVSMQVYALNGQLYRDIRQTAQAGRYELISAIDENITEWHHGARLTLYAPWYAAYGITGTEHIPPYENIRIELAIE